MKAAVRVGILAVVGVAVAAWYFVVRTPEEPPQPSGDVAMVDAGGHTCAVTTGGALSCWGYNKDGQLGLGDTVEAVSPSAVRGLDSGVRSVSVGGSSTCALTEEGTVLCWGRNSSGQLGDTTRKNRTRPVEVDGLGSGVAQISTGGEHACALTTAGDVSCWGRNKYGQLGDGTTKNRSKPTAVTRLDGEVTAISAGTSHTCALLGDGTVRCWGNNASGQLGDGTTKKRSRPTAVTRLDGRAVAVTAGRNHTCALLEGGSVVCWGDNRYGQVGDGTTKDRSEPTEVEQLSAGVLSVAAGSDHTCAVVPGAAVTCWGRNSRGGPLGDGTLTDRTAPVPVMGMDSSVAAVTGGTSHTCALTTTGIAKCWGNNNHGQLGDGTTTNRLPGDVVWE